MIRYAISDDGLQTRIETTKPGWDVAASARTRRLIATKRYFADWNDDEKRVAWTDIKSVFREIQGHKCGYCERPLSASGSNTPAIGGSEHDVEHYRPKARVATWGVRKHAEAPQFDFVWVNQARDGYYWLAFDRWNYCTACKVCNTELKGNRFPIQGAPGGPDLSRSQLDTLEQPLLLFPLGEIDDDPESHIKFNGVAPVAIGGSARGRATIEFFLLDRRDDLERGRTEALLIAWNWIGPELEASAEQMSQRRAQTDALISKPGLLHANFIRSLVRLARSQPDDARELYRAAKGDLTGRGL